MRYSFLIKMMHNILFESSLRNYPHILQLSIKYIIKYCLRPRLAIPLVYGISRLSHVLTLLLVIMGMIMIYNFCGYFFNDVVE